MTQSSRSDSPAIRIQAPHPQLDQEALDFGKMRMGSSSRLQLGLTNDGGGRLEAHAQASARWLNVIPGPYYLGPGQAQPIFVQINTDELVTMGGYADQLILQSNGGQLSIPVTVELVPPFVLDPADAASEIHALPDLVRYCDRNWKSALPLLAEGRIEACLLFLEERHLLPIAQQASSYPDASIGLETLLSSIQQGRSKRPPGTNLRQLESQLGFGLRGIMSTSRPKALTLQMYNPNAKGYLWGDLRPLAPWLSFAPSSFGCGARQTARVRMQIDAALWKRSRKAWATGMDLFEIVLYAPDGGIARRIKQSASPGWGFVALLTALAVLAPLLAAIALILYLGLL